MNVNNQSNKDHTLLPTDNVLLMSYSEDLKVEDKTKVLNYVVELMKFKRNQYLSVHAKRGPGSFQRSCLLLCILLVYMIFAAIVLKDFYQVLYVTAFYGLVALLIEVFVAPKTSKYVADHSYVVYNREINSTLSSKGLNLFGVDMEAENTSGGSHDLSNIRVFRNDDNHEIVGVVCLKPLGNLQENDQSDKIVLKIGILGSSAVDAISKKIYEEMFEWCLTKAQVLKQLQDKEVYLQIDVLGIDNTTMSFLKTKKFTYISSKKTGDSSLFDNTLAFQLQLWELKV